MGPSKEKSKGKKKAKREKSGKMRNPMGPLEERRSESEKK